MKKKILTIATIIVIIPLFLLYGPIEYFRLMVINTFMNTAENKFVVQHMFTENYINEVLLDNVTTTDEKTTGADIGSGTGEFSKTVINKNWYEAHLIKVSPERVTLELADSEKGNVVEDMLGKDGIAAINASGFLELENRGLVSGYCIKDNKLIRKCTTDHKHVVGGMNGNNIFFVGEYSHEEIDALNFKWAFEFGPVLIVNGHKTEITDVAAGIAPRTAIGQTKDGDMLLLVVDGRQLKSIGATDKDVQTLMWDNGAVNAIMLDGGSSTSMAYNGEVVNCPSKGEDKSRRLIPNAIVVKQ